MTSALRWGWVVSSTLRPLYPPGKIRYPLYGRLGRPQGRSGRVRKISPPPGFDSRTVQPVASLYTDWAIAALVGARSTGVYCRQKWNWARRRGHWKPEVDPVVREYVLTGRCRLRKDWLPQKLGTTLVGRGLCIKSGWLPVHSPRGLDRRAAGDRSLWHTITRCTSARAQFELHQS